MSSFKFGRNDVWKEKKKYTDKLIAEAKERYYSMYTSKALTNNGDAGLYYKVVNRLKDRQSQKPFEVCQMKPELTHEEVAEDLANYFSKIFDDFEPLDEGIPPPSKNDPTKLERYQVAARLRKCKKPRALLHGDIFPMLVTTYSDI